MQNCNALNQGSYTISDYAQNLKTKETGRIEKGESSSQKFEEVDMQFEHYHISSIVYQLFPESQKPVETKEIKQEVNNFCPQCGRKLSGNENFCPQCGRKLKTVDVVLV
jgi:NMD protein affecting ribosome stability and mRNA decay